ncbi:MAG: tRNA (N6-isopentenyl adenosine(37)-C2)-methylthiotransferase MiaB [Lentisphaeria bacterium]|nr:tRNA (N6-isopentenyl adenosine(37)-C2)-methylthiotransferase MiaB [Lentisphaeria bacterium]
MKYFIRTYGCQMNERDSEAIGAALEEAGFTRGSEEDCDLLLFNTCSVREAAERKAKGKIGYIRKLKLKKPSLIIGVTGCMAQRLGEELLRELPHLDFVLGTGQMQRLVPLVQELMKERRRCSETELSAEVLESMGGHDQSPSWHGQIAITRGCNRFCSYCIVPYVRGREISRTKESILTEARALTERGVREILLLGQNVAAYGLNGDVRPPAPDHSPFAELLEELNEIPGLLRIRFTSPYVSYFNPRLISAMKNCEKVCRNVHLPLQSGSARILKAMNRQYTAQSYREKVAEIREAIPGITFSTDVIVGVPGEEDSDFALTRELMNEVGFEQAYIFKYSPRPGARSALLEDSVPEEVNEERNQILLDDLKERIGARLSGLVGSTQEVLLEGVSARNPGRWSGRTSTNFVVHFEPDETCSPGTLRQVKISRSGAVSLFGSLLP